LINPITSLLSIILKPPSVITPDAVASEIKVNNEQDAVQAEIAVNKIQHYLSAGENIDEST